MSEITVTETLSYSASTGAGAIAAKSGAYPFSGPADMGGKGIDTNPEELLLGAVASCFTLTLSIVLHIAHLPYADLRIQAEGLITGLPRDLKYTRITVHPEIVGADDARRDAYLAAVTKSHDRCFIGQAVKGNVEYVVGNVTVG